MRESLACVGRRNADCGYPRWKGLRVAGDAIAREIDVGFASQSITHTQTWTLNFQIMKIRGGMKTWQSNCGLVQFLRYR